MFMHDAEELHRALYEAHWLLNAAAAKIHAVTVACHAAGRHADARTELAPIVAELNKARDAADLSSGTAATARMTLIRTTGCDGSCHRNAEKVVARTLSARKPEPSTNTNKNETGTIEGTETD